MQFQKQDCVNFLNSVERETDPGVSQDTDSYTLSDPDFEDDPEEMVGSSLGMGSSETRGHGIQSEETWRVKEMEYQK